MSRVVGAYLIQQYFTERDGGIPDYSLGKLEELYRGLAKANESFKRRLEFASSQDANVNAMCALSVISQGVSFFISEHLEHLKAHFAPHPMTANLAAPQVVRPRLQISAADAEEDSLTPRESGTVSDVSY